ncbi:hypothetical protein Nepgr_027149 [Nepenthes gracilis]|uniref:Uncharacterized protein n=1 Tax=Nepenthes gracilis TaxID=150966 RepID=A0AAD3Y394_NEPGR|nr:hypothetical protein Nepgr_027149 [Nepenthes gracilis]
MPDRNTGFEMAIFDGLPPLFEICNEPRIEEASSALMISGFTQSAHLQDQVQGVAAVSEVSPEDVTIPSNGPTQSQPVVNPPCPEKETCPPGVPASNPREVQDRVRLDWINTPASSSHPSPGGHPDRPSTPASRMSLNEIALNARFIQASFLSTDEKLNEIMRIGIHQRRLWIGHLQQEVRSLSQNRVDPLLLEETRNKIEAAIAEAQQYKDQNINLQSELQKARDELQSSKLHLTDFQNELSHLN